MKGKKAVQSKFPTARIKKIMQADEDVGKIAQSTPIVVSRALELFLKDVVTEACGVVRQSGGKKVLPLHVKRLVAQNRQYDFLDDLVASIVDPTAGVGGAAAPPMPAHKPASKPGASSRAPANQVDDGDDDEDEEEEY